MRKSFEVVTGGEDPEAQMAAIRQVLADVDQETGTEPEAEAEETPAPMAPRAPVRHRDDDAESDRMAALRLESHINAGWDAEGRPSLFRCDVNKLRRSHDKRVKKLLRSEARRKKSGAFLTGFTLVTVLTAALVGLYVLHPQIIAASPTMAPAMNEYVATVDHYRVEVNENTTEWTGWLIERVGRLAARVE